MVLQAGPVHVHVAALADGKQGPQQAHGRAQGAHVRVRAVIARPVPGHAPRDIHAREIVLQGYLQVRIRFIVPQHDVVPRPVLFDEVALQDQGLDLAVRHDGLDIVHMTGHGHDFRRMAARGTEIAVHPVIQVFGLAHVNDAPRGCRAARGRHRAVIRIACSFWRPLGAASGTGPYRKP